MSAPVAYRSDVAHEVVVGLRLTGTGISRAEAVRLVQTALKPYGMVDHVAWAIGGTLVFHARLQTPPSESDLEAHFGIPTLTFAERNRAMRVAVKPDDTFYDEQWALRHIGVEQAWAAMATAPAAPVTVAVVDSGTAVSHPDLMSALWTNPAPTFGDLRGARMIGTVTDGLVADDDGHGTRLAGTIAAVTNNALGIASASSPATVKIMTLKCFDLETPPTSAAASRAIAYAIEKGARIVNLSWDVGMPQAVLRITLEAAAAADVLVVAAAGNDGTDNDTLPTWPANYALANVMSVMATDRYDDRASFSDYGETTVHLAAPGVSLLATDIFLFTALVPGTPRYRAYGGTSASCALVSAAAALLRALNPSWPAPMVREHLMASADVLPSLQTFAGGRLNRCAGRLNIGRAVCGPLEVIVPRAGDEWRRNTLVPVEWRNMYRTPACETVEIRISDDGGATFGERLVQGMTNDGACMVKAPDRRIRNARLRIQSEQGHVYADSGVFEVRR